MRVSSTPEGGLRGSNLTLSPPEGSPAYPRRERAEDGTGSGAPLRPRRGGVRIPCPQAQPRQGPNVSRGARGGARSAGLTPPRPCGRYPAPSRARTAVARCTPTADPPVGRRQPPLRPVRASSRGPVPSPYLRSLFPEAAPFQAVRNAMDAGRTRTGARAAPRGGVGCSGGSRGSTWTRGRVGGTGPAAPPRRGRAPPFLPGTSVPPERTRGRRASPLLSRAVETHH